jgi:hypothetical protein
MTPLLVATRGLIPCRSPLKIAALGFIGSCGGVIPEVEPPATYPGGGSPAMFPTPEDRLKRLIERDDEEIITILVAAITQGIIK